MPATDTPATGAPSTNVPPTNAPSTDAPSPSPSTSQKPATDAPQTNVPLTDMPSTNAPETNVPLTNAPTNAPSPSLSNSQMPATDAPSPLLSTLQKQATESPPLSNQPSSTSDIANGWTPVPSPSFVENGPSNRPVNVENMKGISPDSRPSVFQSNMPTYPQNSLASEQSRKDTSGSQGVNFSVSHGPNKESDNFVQTVQTLASTNAPLIIGMAISTSLLTPLLSMILPVSSTVVAATIPSAAAPLVRYSVPTSDMFSFWLLLDYLQFLASSGQMVMPAMPHFYHEFTDSLAWTTFNVPPTWSNVSTTASPSFMTLSIAEGDIIAGVLAYAQRLDVNPMSLFTVTVVGFSAIVGAALVIVAFLYAIVVIFFRQRLRRVKIKLKNDIPKNHLFLRLLIQAALGVCLISEYALSMTASFELRFSDSNGLCMATLALSLICCGVLVLGVCMLYGKTSSDLSDPGFHFTWGGYYKTYRFECRYFFVPKMGAEICSGLIIGAVSNVPTQLALLLTLQFTMFLVTTHADPYILDFQNVCACMAYIMKILTYALLSTFVTTDVDPEAQEIIGTCALVLQIILILLFNSRQLYILAKQLKCLFNRWRKVQRKQNTAPETSLPLDRNLLTQSVQQTHHPVA
ncbi:mucin [Thraustotheca clavata]|uniref:Mucin n=1 Tax=Thraustotheca clavata TaxID=74557 RepID=A0A1V9ZBN1_9STRA|nr:mucin [Thraustotheca clavata]